jgi:membrane protease YdiL (CAAX protease family)
MRFNKNFLIIVLIIIAPFLILFSKALPQANYLVASFYKLIFVVPIVFRLFVYRFSIKKAFTAGFDFKLFKKNFWPVFSFGIILSLIYMTAYLITERFLNFQNIIERINSYAAVDATKIMFVGVYMITINSLIEEFFWRGFVFQELSKRNKAIVAQLLTGIGFAIYHVAIFYDWFNPIILGIATFGLTGYSIIMNYIYKAYKDLFSCWLVHAMVDTVQILIAFRIFGLI